MTKKILIIGAGPGGLASAVLLAAQGLQVEIMERLPIVGGRTFRIEADGYKFDLGPTFFLYPRVLEEIFRSAGTSLRAEVEMLRLDPQYRIQFGYGGKLDCTSDVAAMEKQIAALEPTDAPGFRRFLDENRTKLAVMEPCLEDAFLGWQDLAQTRLLKMLPLLRPHESVGRYLKLFFTDERVPTQDETYRLGRARAAVQKVPTDLSRTWAARRACIGSRELNLRGFPNCGQASRLSPTGNRLESSFGPYAVNGLMRL